MPIYESDELSRDKLQELRKRNRCKECGGMLNVFMDFKAGKAFLACNDWRRTHHEGIEREASQYEQKGLESLNIPTRRELMVKEYGPEKTRALEKYRGMVSLSKTQAREILEVVFPDAPETEMARAVLLCATYGLNPLMKHIFLIKFNRWNKEHTRIIGEDWATVMGITAKRLLASRRGNYSYVDNTPRVMTEEEQETVFGEVDAGKLWVCTKLRDPQTGAEAVGYGFWSKDSQPYGTEKGNTKFNMAAIRSESQALDRLRPGEMPVGIEVMPEEVVENLSGKIIESEAREVESFNEIPRGAGETDELAEPEEIGAVGPSEAVSPAPKAGKIKKTEPPGLNGRPAAELVEADFPDYLALCHICFYFYDLQPAKVWKEIGYPSSIDARSAGKTPWQCWQEIKSVRGE